MARPSPMNLALVKAGKMSSSSLSAQDINATISDTMRQFGEAAQAKMAADNLKEILNPKAPDPIDQFAKTATVFQTMAGLRSNQEEAERKREEVERRERIEAERLEEQKRAMAQNQSLELFKLMMQMNQESTKNMQEMIKSVQEGNQKQLEKMEINQREMLKTIVGEKQKSPIEEKLLSSTLDQILKPRQPEDPIQSLVRQKEVVNQLSSLFPSPVVSSGGINELEYELKKLEIKQKGDMEEKRIKVEELKAEKIGSSIESAATIISGIIAQMKQGNQHPQQQQAMPQQPEAPMARVPLARYECVNEECGNEWVDLMGIKNVICPKCKESMEVDWSNAEPQVTAS